MIERGHRRLNRRDHINAVAAALRVSPAELAPAAGPGLDEWAPAPSAPAFPAVRNELTVTRHARLAGEFIVYVARGDALAAGQWLRRAARDPGVSPWLLLEFVAAHHPSAPEPHPHPAARERQPVQARETP